MIKAEVSILVLGNLVKISTEELFIWTNVISLTVISKYAQYVTD